MARGTPPRPSGGAGRPPPARQPRPAPAQQRRAADQRRRAVEQHRVADQQRRGEQARRGAGFASQHRQRQQQFLREAHGARREAEAQRRTEQIRQVVARLESILAAGLRRSARIDLDSLRRPPPSPEFDPGPLGVPAPEPRPEDFAPARLGARWGGQARRAQRQAAAREAYRQAQEGWEAAERERVEQLAAAEQAHRERLAAERVEIEAFNSRIARVAAGLRQRHSPVLESFLRTVLRRVPLPRGFPRRAELTHRRDTEEVTLRVVLPGSDVVPAVNGYEYATPADEIRPVPRPDDDADDLYYQVVAQVALLVVRDVLEAEPGLDRISFHGLVDHVDPDTGEPSLPCVLSFHASRAEFAALDLTGQSPEECLDRLDARVSPDLSAHQPVATTTGPA